MSSNSVCNHSRGKQIGPLLRGRPILLSLVRLQTELDSTQSHHHFLIEAINRDFNCPLFLVYSRRGRRGEQLFVLLSPPSLPHHPHPCISKGMDAIKIKMDVKHLITLTSNVLVNHDIISCLNDVLFPNLHHLS